MLLQVKKIPLRLFSKPSLIERFAYSCYLKSELELKILEGEPHKISVLGNVYSKDELYQYFYSFEGENLRQDYKERFVNLLIEWIEDDTIPEDYTLNDRFEFFDYFKLHVLNKKRAFDSFEKFVTNKIKLATFIHDYAPKYIDQREQKSNKNTRKRFSNSDVLVYLIHLEKFWTSKKELEIIIKTKVLFEERFANEPTSFKKSVLIVLLKNINASNEEGKIASKNKSLKIDSKQTIVERIVSHAAGNIISNVYRYTYLYLTLVIITPMAIGLIILKVHNNNKNKIPEVVFPEKTISRISDSNQSLSTFFDNMFEEKFKNQTSDIDSANFWLKKADESYDKNDFNNALLYVNNAIKLDQKFYTAYFIRMKVYVGLNLFNDAISDVDILFKNYRVGSIDFLYYGIRSNLKRLNQDYKGALMDMDSTISSYEALLKNTSLKENRPAYGIVHSYFLFSRGKIHYTFYKYEDAVRDIEKATELYQNDSEYYIYLSSCYYHLNQLEKCITVNQFILTKWRDVYILKRSYEIIAAAYIKLGATKKNVKFRISHLKNSIVYTDSFLLIEPNDYDAQIAKNKCEEVVNILE